MTQQSMTPSTIPAAEIEIRGFPTSVSEDAILFGAVHFPYPGARASIPDGAFVDLRAQVTPSGHLQVTSLLMFRDSSRAVAMTGAREFASVKSGHAEQVAPSVPVNHQTAQSSAKPAVPQPEQASVKPAAPVASQPPAASPAAESAFARVFQRKPGTSTPAASASTQRGAPSARPSFNPAAVINGDPGDDVPF